MAKYIKGLFKDTAHIDQPEGSWRYAKNMNVHPVTAALSNEDGNEAVQAPWIDILIEDKIYNTLPIASIIVGAINISDDRIILFIVYDRASSVLTSNNGNVLPTLEPWTDIYGTNAAPIYNGEIGVFDKDVYNTLYRPPVTAAITDIEVDLGTTRTRLDLNFNRNHFIEGTYKINPEGDLFVYWTDDLNPPRAFNVTRQGAWLAENSITTPTDRLYGIDFATSTNLHHNEMLNLFPSSGPTPHVELDDIRAGGGLLTAVYYLALAYVDQDLVQTNYLVISNPISIVEDVEGVLPIERYDGSNPKTPSGKALSWSITNVNTDYSYIRPAVIRRMDGQDLVFGLSDVPVQNLITTGRNSITFTGLEDYKGLSVNDIIIDNASYDTAKTINQLDGTLYLGNVRGSKDLGYQKYANFIKSHAVVKEFPNFDPREYTLDVLENGYIETSPFGDPETIADGYRHAENIYKYKGYQRDEVYGFYIAFILNDGTESYAYHIPGREQLKIQNNDGNNTVGEVPSYAFGSGGGWFQQDGSTNPGGFDNLFLWNNMCGSGTGSQCMETQDVQAGPVVNMSDGAGRMFHFYETSPIRSATDPYSRGARNMNFWQNTTEFYPADDINGENWEIWDASLQGLAMQNTNVFNVSASSPATANGFSIGGYTTNVLRGQRVRHHHFPSNENEGFKTILSLSDTISVAIEPYKREWYTIDFSWCTNQTYSGSSVVVPGFGNYSSMEAALDSGTATTIIPGETGQNIEEVTGGTAFGGPANLGGYADANDLLQALEAEAGNSKFFHISRFNQDRSGFSGEYPNIGDTVEFVWMNHGSANILSDGFSSSGYEFPPAGAPYANIGESNAEMYRRIAGTYNPSVQYANSDPLSTSFKIECKIGVGPIDYSAGNVYPCTTAGDFFVQGGNSAFGIQTDWDCHQGGYNEFGTTQVGYVNDAQANGSWYFPLGCIRKPRLGFIAEHLLAGYGCMSAYNSPRLRKYRNRVSDNMWIVGLPVPILSEFYPGKHDRCTDKKKATVIWHDGENNLIFHYEDSGLVGGANNTNMPDIATNPLFITHASSMVGWIAWAKGHNELKGTIAHKIQALGIQFEDIKVPPEIWEKTQGFRIFYAKREHADKRILGQSLINPYAPTWEKAFPGCASMATMGDTWTGGIGNVPAGQNEDRMWVNWPYSLPSYAYPSIRHFTEDPDRREYQGIGMHDFYLMRSRRTLAAATHTKVEYAVEMFPITGPGFTQNCWYENDNQDLDPEGANYGILMGSFQGDLETPLPAGATDCSSICVSNEIINSMLIGFNYYSPSQISVTDNGGGTNGLTMYNWLGGPPSASGASRYVDLNRVIKERCKTYLRGDSIYNGRQLGFGYKTYNDFGESHMSFLLNENNTLRAFQPEASFGTAADPTYPTWVKTDVQPDIWFQAVDLDSPPEPKPVYYLNNLHAFRLDMYNSVDTQDLVWTGYEVTGEDYKKFWVDEDGAAVISAADGSTLMSGGEDYTDLGDGVSTENVDKVSRFKTAHVFGGDTFICRYGYRKTLRPNLMPLSSVIGAGNVDAAGLGNDVRMLYDVIVESTDNINFRHMEDRTSSYYPGAPAKDLLALDNDIDLTALGKMKYNDDYSNVNDVGHTVPLPLQISQPSNFPTRVIRSTKADDTTLKDAFRSFLVIDFKDLPKNRGELWKLSVFNNLLYLHMQNSLFKTRGKQTMQLGDGSEAFVGSGNIFAQSPEELMQTSSGYGGLQSQWSTCVTKHGYFFVDQKNKRVFMATDRLTDIGSLGLDKWFSNNIAYDLEYFGKRNFEDSPLLFSFISTWDDEFQRIILTKRELSPTRYFELAWIAWLTGTLDTTYGAIRYNSETDAFDHSADGITWSEIVISGIDGTNVANRPLFETSGWTISYYPSLQTWTSFHDYYPYRYLTTSKNLYSVRAYSPNILTQAQYANSENWLHRLVWRHNSLNNKGNFYGIITDPDIGEYTSVSYQSEVEVVHNQGKDLSKLFHNFSFITEVINQDIAEGTTQMDYIDNRLSTKLDIPGIDRFILYNTHQCSGEIHIEELINTRRNGKEWYINKFRDHTSGTVSSIVGTANDAEYYDLYFYNNGLPITPGGVVAGATTNVSVDNSGSLWYISGMNESLDAGTAFDSVTTKKFVDKFLAIRLIISNSANNLVNLYSTNVGARKFLR
jgi:hypothetical protein